jgi:hypothetical protein
MDSFWNKNIPASLSNWLLANASVVSPTLDGHSNSISWELYARAQQVTLDQDLTVNMNGCHGNAVTTDGRYTLHAGDIELAIILSNQQLADMQEDGVTIPSNIVTADVATSNGQQTAIIVYRGACGNLINTTVKTETQVTPVPPTITTPTPTPTIPYKIDDKPVPGPNTVGNLQGSPGVAATPDNGEANPIGGIVPTTNESSTTSTDNNEGAGSSSSTTTPESTGSSTTTTPALDETSGSTPTDPQGSQSTVTVPQP